VTTQNVFHALSCLLSYRIIMPTTWVWPRERWVEAVGQQTVEPELKFFILLYVARYLSDLVFVFVEPRRSDFAAIVLHHLATVSLILAGVTGDRTREIGIGLLFFSYSEVCVLSAKACLYLSASKNDWYQFFANRFFELFVVVFFVTKTIMATFVIYNATEHVVKGDDFLTNPALQISVLFAWILIGLLTFWLVQVVRAVVRISIDGEVSDPRSDDEGEAADKQPPIARKKRQ